MAQLVARKSHNLKVPGSIPGGGILIPNTVRLITLIGFYFLPLYSHEAFVAQTVERQPFKLLAVGSIPTEGVIFVLLNM